VTVIVSVAEGVISGVRLVVEVAEFTGGSGVLVESTAKVPAIAVFNMASAVPALSTTGGEGGAGAGVNGRQADVRRINATKRTALFIWPSLGL